MNEELSTSFLIVFGNDELRTQIQEVVESQGNSPRVGEGFLGLEFDLFHL